MNKIKTGYGWPHDVSETDLEIKFCRGSGNGGQKKQKTSSACQIKHIPTGIQVRSEESRSQLENKKAAWKKLTDKLIPLMKQLLQEKYKVEKINTDRIRSYNEKDQRVVDSRLDNSFNYDSVLYKDELDDIIVELIKNN